MKRGLSQERQTSLCFIFSLYTGKRLTTVPVLSTTTNM